MRLDLPRLIFFLASALIVAGILLHGVGFSEIQRIWDHLIARPGGSLALRFFVQPAMSVIFAARDGIKDARTGRSPYIWMVVSDPSKRKVRLHEGVAATGKIILVAIALDAVYQYIAYKDFFPVEAVLVAILLAFIPYLLLRGPFARIACWWMKRESGGAG